MQPSESRIDDGPYYFDLYRILDEFSLFLRPAVMTAVGNKNADQRSNPMKVSNFILFVMVRCLYLRINRRCFFLVISARSSTLCRSGGCDPVTS